MPIKPENRDRYPDNWKQIRERILARAGNCCEQCRVPNGVTVLRGMASDKGRYQMPDGVVRDAENGGLVCLRPFEFLGTPVKIVLTVAHLDHTPENCADDNLKALCQWHHLRYDAKHHAETARQTRRAKLAIGDLFATNED
ncbi:hypothetical protein [Paraburkholderia bannensis]|uniref:hypothetical protein n=1 Tax=Paraburkholderia bannensis TaxID=765414 RepID=UPI002AB71040|nr:hypothetical protein [Paraburkholderia bannensis]